MASLFQKYWRLFCRFIVTTFYRRSEHSGLSNLPTEGPVILCANHANALADAVIIQAINQRTVHPLARSGLFKNPLLRPILALLQAIPVYRRQDIQGDTSRNTDSFARCYEMLNKDAVILIFPEGQSHSDARLRDIKTGAARLTLGSIKQGIDVKLIPIGLNFLNKGSFRGDVFIKLGPPIPLDAFANSNSEDDYEAVKRLTVDIQNALESVTINVESLEDLDFLHRMERFFSMRHGKYRTRSMERRFKALKKIAQASAELQQQHPTRIKRVKRRLMQFERLCQHWGIRDYHLTIQYKTTLIGRFIVRSLFILLFVLPVASWGLITSYVPFILTRHVAKFVSKGIDQYDTAKILIGLFLFSVFWALQISYIYNHYSALTTVIFALSLPIGAAVAQFYRKEQDRIRENLRVFLLFVRKRKLKRYLQHKRKLIEHDLAQLVRLVKKEIPS